MPLQPITLYGEQKRVLFLPPTDPIQIKGVAGSGKTTVALYRAKHLLETQNNLFQEARVAIFTYNKTLVAYIKSLLPLVTGGYQQNSDELIKRSSPGLNVQITNFHKWAYDFLQARGYKLYENNRFLSDSDQHSIIVAHITRLKTQYPNSTLLTKQIDFFIEEIAWMKGKLFKSSQEYVDAKRTGRGTSDRIVKDDKQIIWLIYQNYNSQIAEKNKIDFDDYAILVLKEIEKDSGFVPPFTHIIVDEAQDLNKAQMLTLSKIVTPATNSISIIADAAQRIYKSGFTWSEIGINVRGGRTIEFKKNYRNTVKIATLAGSLLNHEEDKSEFTPIEAHRTNDFSPIINICRSWDQQAELVVAYLKDLKSKNLLNDTVVLHRNHAGCQKINDYLVSKGFQTHFLRKNTPINFSDSLVKICTLSSIKGLEFNNVIIIDLNDDIIPYPSGFNGDNDEFHISTERRLLYTAMTRAKEQLNIYSSGTQSRYLNELDHTYAVVNNLSSKTIVSTPIDDLPF